MKFKRRQNNRNRSGFTLMELLLVMAILVIMASMVGVAFLNANQNAQEDAVRLQIKTYKDACKQFKLHVGYFPKQLPDLVQKPANDKMNRWRGPYLETDNLNGFLDPWGNQYNYQANDATQQVQITSSGADGSPGTQDDIPTQQEMTGN